MNGYPDGNEIDAFGGPLRLNSNSTRNVSIARKGGNVSIGFYDNPSQKLAVYTAEEQDAIAAFCEKPGFGAVTGKTRAPLVQDVPAWGVQGKHVTAKCEGYLGYENGIYVPDSPGALGRFGVYGKSESVDAYGGYFEGPAIGLGVFGADNDGEIAALKIRSSYGGQYILLDGNEIDSNVGLHLNGNSGQKVTLGGDVGIKGSVKVEGRLIVKDVAYADRGNAQYDPANDTFYYDSSSRRFKENIQLLMDDFDKLLDAEPRTYTRPHNPDRWEIGYIAEEVAELGLDRLLYYDVDGAPNGVNYSKLPLYLAQIAKGHQERLDEKDTEIAELRERLDRLEALVAQLAPSR